MSFISYAQNYEDVILWRALKHIECGFYIDVGANDPEIDSVTKAFYDRGWRGINLEPIAQWFIRLKEDRQRDINLQMAAGDKKGKLVIYELKDTGLSTCVKETAERHIAEHGYSKLERVVPVETLTSICQQYHMAPIHFLKIDVEGSEKDVLNGLDLSVIRPWIIVVESTLPNSQIENNGQWEAILYASKYEYVFFDGLNRYYVAHEHQELKSYFNSPANVFDGFITRQQFILELRSQEQEQRAIAAENRAQEQEQRAIAAENRAQEREQRAIALENSLSWRITGPLRAVQDMFNGDFKTTISYIRNIIRYPLLLAMRVVLAHPEFSYWLNQNIQLYPWLYKRLLSMAQTGGLIPVGLQNQATMNTDALPKIDSNADANNGNLSLRARRIYYDLKTAIEYRQKEKDRCVL